MSEVVQAYSVPHECMAYTGVYLSYKVDIAIAMAVGFLLGALASEYMRGK